jgi:hypothetical protein
MRVRIPVKRRSYGRLNFHRHRFDWDAQVYFNRIRSAAGIELSLEDRTNIGAFCKGLKKLGYWNSLVEGWTMRSTQNAGTGVTVYGLKGAKDGLIFGGGAWGANGITLDANTKGIGLSALTTFSGTNPWTLLFVFDYLGADASRPLLKFSGVAGTSPQTVAIECTGTSALIRKYLAGVGTGITSAVAGAVGGFGYVCASRVNTDWDLNQNGTETTGSDAVSLVASADYNIGNQFSDSQLTADCQFAHVFLFNMGLDFFVTPPNVLNLAQIIALLKTTISQGLALP